MWSAKIGQYA